MKAQPASFLRSVRHYLLLALCMAGFGMLPTARAGVNFRVELYRNGSAYYLMFPSLTTNSASANPSDTGYFAWSHGATANSGSHGQLYADGTHDSGSGSYADYASFIQEVTNLWTLMVTNTTSTNTYTFAVTDFPSNAFPVVTVTFPTDGATGVTNLPTFTWQGPTNYDELYVQVNNSDYSFAHDAYLPLTQTNWTCPEVLGNGSNYVFSAIYNRFADATVTASVPTNTLGEVFPNWSSTSLMQTFQGLPFTVAGSPAIPWTGGHRLVAHYAFDDGGNLGTDSSGNANDMNGGSWWGDNHEPSTDAEAGGGAVQFHGASSLNPSDTTRTNWNLTLAASFSMSAWVKTTASTGSDSDDAISGAAIFWAYNDQGGANDTIPLAITGDKAAFSTRDHSGATTTLHSTTSVNDGNYHLIAVTRNSLSGEKKIYVDGNLEGSEIGATDRLNGNDYFLSIGGSVLASYSGILDDVQIYAGVLDADEITALYTSPGVPSPDKTAAGLQAHYDFDEGVVIAPDMSGNGNHIVYAGQFSGGGPGISTDSKAGAGSISFDGGSYLTASSNLLSTLAGNFTVSLWLKTSQNFGNQGDEAWAGAGIIAADSPNSGAMDLIPIALTGGQVAFNIGDGNSDSTLNSATTVNDAVWHHVVVTRNQSTGERQIFIDGTLDASDTAATNFLDTPVLLAIGAKSDAFDADPASPDYNGSNGYEGLLDDIQFYNHVLSSADVAFLHAKPGATVSGVTVEPYPVDVEMTFTLMRKQEADGSESYICFPFMDSITPSPATTNRISSPNGGFSSESTPSSGFTSSWITGSLGALLNELTNGLWTISINSGSPTQQVYSFSVSVNDLDTNVIQTARIISPASGSSNIATNPVFNWSGPTNYQTLSVELQGNGQSLPVSTTSWPSPASLGYGTNEITITYISGAITNLTVTTPVDSALNPVRTWTPHMNLQAAASSRFVVGASAPLPVRLTNIVSSVGRLQFSFPTLAGRPHTIQATTNLTSGQWQDLSNFVGDGSLRQFSFSTTNPPAQFFRIRTQ